ncbi:hypothetical protein ACFQ2B_14985 [Streptomyces stramineus]
MVTRQALALASGGLRKGLAFKVGIPAMGILMGLLMIVGMLAGIGGGPSAVAAGCAKPGSPGSDGSAGNGQTGDTTGVRARSCARSRSRTRRSSTTWPKRGSCRAGPP